MVKVIDIAADKVPLSRIYYHYPCTLHIQTVYTTLMQHGRTNGESFLCRVLGSLADGIHLYQYSQHALSLPSIGLITVSGLDETTLSSERLIMFMIENTHDK